ncbi:unnamed protein product [Paramecium sonneborni]|uniref:Uncharacterized protein n=1 Tax=Paramecium sonneborni TaxID=65129 RepID=A0A8S1ML24_9CILI|nr:unnamed protein product [Paramecium sonneborni]
MATHSISKFKFNNSINKEQIKLLKQQLNDKNIQDSQISNSQQSIVTNLTQQIQKLNSQSLNFNNIFDEIQQLKPIKYNQYRTFSSHNLDQSLTKILQKLQKSTPNHHNQHEINNNTQNYKKQSQPINNTIQNNEGTIKEDYQF